MSAQWLLLIASLPTTGATARMRLWRSIKSLGCGSLRDGAYLLPDTPEHAQALADLCEQTNNEGGSACLVHVLARSAKDEEAFRALFDRSAEYGQLESRLMEAKRALAEQSAGDVAKTLKRMRREIDAIQRVDFFPNQASNNVQAAWSDFNEAATAVLSPDEPHAEQHPIMQMDRSGYQGRTWATRRGLWADRVASAWLIRRFIDPDARFVWLDHPADCPPEALGFDFDGASFTHVGDKVSFEVLMATFGLQDDHGLAQLARLVHILDVGGGTTPEAIGCEAILSGARLRLTDDDQFLHEMGSVFDSLYAHYNKKDAQ